VVMAGANAAPWSASFTLAKPQQGVTIGLLPMFPDGEERELKVEVSIDGGAPITVSAPRVVGSAGWVTGVLDNLLKLPVAMPIAAGPHRITITPRSSGIALDQVVLEKPVEEKVAH